MAWSDAARAAALEARRMHAKQSAKKQARFTFHVPTKAYLAGSSGMIRVGGGHTLRGTNSQEARTRLYRMLDLKQARQTSQSGTHPYVKSRAYAKNQIAVNKALAKRSK